MNSKRMFYVMIGLLMLSLLATVGGAYLVNARMQTQAKALLALKLRRAVLAQEQDSLTIAKKDVAKYLPLEHIAKQIVPQDKNQAEAIREIVNMAAASGISPTSISFPSSTLGANTPLAPAAAGSAATPPAAPVPSASNSLSQLRPVTGIPGVYELEITIQQDASRPVPYSQFIAFLSRLEQNRRTAQVTSITLQPSAKNHNALSFTLAINEFIKP